MPLDFCGSFRSRPALDAQEVTFGVFRDIMLFLTWLPWQRALATGSLWVLWSPQQVRLDSITFRWTCVNCIFNGIFYSYSSTHTVLCHWKIALSFTYRSIERLACLQRLPVHLQKEFITTRLEVIHWLVRLHHQCLM